MKTVKDQKLTQSTLGDIVCCPGGLEIKGQKIKGEIEQTLTWREKMLKLGMKGFVSYQDGVPRGFIEYMPAQTAPFPIEASGSAVLMCYHWVLKNKVDEEEHLAQEKRLIQLVIEEAKDRFSGIATLGWDHPTHFPIRLLEELGFQQLERYDYIALMWLLLKEKVPRPKMAPPRFKPQDLSSKGLLAVEFAWSSRCPYSIHNVARLEQIICEIPGKERIRTFLHRIDTHNEAIRWSISPWDWAWLFLNGGKVLIHEFPEPDEVKRLIEEKISKLQP